MPIREHGLGRQDLRLGLGMPVTLEGLPDNLAVGGGSCPLLLSINAWKDGAAFV